MNVLNALADRVAEAEIDKLEARIAGLEAQNRDLYASLDTAVRLARESLLLDSAAVYLPGPNPPEMNEGHRALRARLERADIALKRATARWWQTRAAQSRPSPGVPVANPGREDLGLGALQPNWPPQGQPLGSGPLPPKDLRH